MSACDAPSDSPAASPSAEGLRVLAKPAPSGERAIAWREVEGLGVPAWLFYPAAPSVGAETLPAEPAPLPESYAAGLRRRFGPVAAATLVAAPGHARFGAAIAEGRHPLIVFTPGAAMGGRDYRLFVEALAARSYAVLVLRPTGSPRATEERYGEAASEIVAALAALRGVAGGDGEGGIDTARPVLVGHSLGGAAAVLSATRTGACAVNLDGDFGGATARPAPAVPLLYVIGDPALDRPADLARRAEVWRGVAGSAGVQALALGISGMRHFDLADAAHLPPGLIPADRREGRFGSIGGAAAQRVLVDIVVQFVEACRTGTKAPLSAVLRLPPEARPIFTQ